jgi:hypothetical protein
VAAGGTTISFTPDTVQVDPGQSFTLEIALDSGTFMRGASCTINFDPDMLECVSVTEGDIFQGWAGTHGAETIAYPKPNLTKTPGSVDTGISIMGGNETPDLDGPDSGVFLVCEFKAKSGVNGTTSITLSEVVAVTNEINNLGMLQGKEIDGVTASQCQVTVGTPAATSSAAPTTTVPKTTTTTSKPTVTTTSKPPVSTIKTSTSQPATTSQPLTTTTSQAPQTVTVTQPPTSTAPDSTGATPGVPWAMVGGIIGGVLLVGVGGFLS